MSKQLFILTDQVSSQLHPDDHGLIDEFKISGIEAVPVIWDELNVIPESKLLIRTPWDYPLKIKKFFELLDSLDAASCCLINSTKIVRWNLDKAYMHDLVAWGIPVVPTRLIEDFGLSRLETEFGYPFVLKPRFGASGRNTFLIKSPEDLNRCTVLAGTKVLMQPFIPSIQTEGEYSFMCFGGDFSHAVQKIARSGEFRIQEEHGGQVIAYIPKQTEIDFVRETVKKMPFDLPYARIDIVKHEGNILLMELEAIEPQLFFKYSSPSMRQFVNAISPLCR